MSTFTSEPGTRLGGRYRLEDRIAADSGWAAWKAIDEILARAVTVFTFAPGYPRIREVITAARAASRLTDSRLTQVFDVEDDWDHAYIVMEWATGETVDDLLSAGPVDPARGARIVAEAAAALSVAHAAGLTHLCLTPGSLRWTQGGGVKVVGLGIDAALAGITAEDPALADTLGLGRVLYAALTGHWPGPDYPALPPAPMADGHPRSPRQVRAGVPTSLDDITCRALQLRGRDGGPGLTTPGQLATALVAVIPPAPLPPVSPPSRGNSSRQAFQQGPDDGYWPERDRQDRNGAAGRMRPSRQQPGGRAASKVRAGVIVVLILVAVTGVAAATSHLWPRHAAAAAGGSAHSAGQSASSAAVLAPLSAHGFDALSTPQQDPGDENDSMAYKAIDASKKTAWSTDFYRGSPVFGGLKAGTGLILDMGEAVRLSSVTVTFGPADGAGAAVQIKVGNSNIRSPATHFTMVTSATRLGGTHVFSASSTATGQYVLIWFTSLPPMSGVPKSQDKFQAEIFNIIVRGTAVQASG
jgi:hypothetical protein